MVSKSITDKYFSLRRLVLGTPSKPTKGTYLKNMHTKCKIISPTVARIEAQNTQQKTQFENLKTTIFVSLASRVNTY